MNMIPAGSTSRRKATEIVDLFDNPVGYLPTCGRLQVLQFRNLKAAKLLFYKEFIQKLKFLHNSSINPGTEILKGGSSFARFAGEDHCPQGETYHTGDIHRTGAVLPAYNRIPKAPDVAPEFGDSLVCSPPVCYTTQGGRLEFRLY
jgi:hypothetical protein